MNKPLDIQLALDHLRKADPKLARIIDTYGVIEHRTMKNSIDSVVRIITGQQLSGAVAETIFKRVRCLDGKSELTTSCLQKVSEKQLRAAGLSWAKCRSVKHLAQEVATRRLTLKRLESLNDDEVFDAITQVKGMGPWSANIYLMFVLNRPDVFAENDQGIRTAIRRLYRIADTSEARHRLARRWRPYRSVACWYLWRSLENRPEK